MKINLSGALFAATFLAGCSTPPPPPAPNTLTEAEKAEGWHLLWDGESLDGWVGVKNKCEKAPEKGWQIEDGVLTVLPSARITPEGKWEKLPKETCLGGGGDIVTRAKFTDFALKLDFRLTHAGNSGIKYFFDEKVDKGTTLEYQILDPAHPDSTKGKDGNRRVASLYDLIPARAEAYVKPAGEWNTAMIVSQGSHVEHWLNGVKVLQYTRGGEAFRAAVDASKYATWGVDEKGKKQRWGETKAGRILLQDHADSTVSFRNIKIKRL